MLPKKYRLPLRTELHRLQKEGRLYHFPFFGLLAGKNNLPVSRFAFIVSKKIHKKAVRRNRIKRLLREAARELLPQIKPGFDVVFLTKKNIIDQDLSSLLAAMKIALQKAGLL